jgi:hypothetical protein
MQAVFFKIFTFNGPKSRSLIQALHPAHASIALITRNSYTQTSHKFQSKNVFSPTFTLSPFARRNQLIDKGNSSTGEKCGEPSWVTQLAFENAQTLSAFFDLPATYSQRSVGW